MTSDNTANFNCVAKPTKDRSDLYYDLEEEFNVNEVEEDYTYEESVEERDSKIYEVPLFDGHAKMTARVRLPAKHFDIWAEVTAVCGEGTLVSASGMRDHLWLGFVGEKAVLRYDVGSGPLELHTGKVRTDGRSKISARRYKKDGVLNLGSSSARGSTEGRMSSLDVDPFVYVGHAPDNVTKLSGASSVSGFIGCVHRLRVSGRELIPPARGLITTSHGIRACNQHNLARLVCP